MPDTKFSERTFARVTALYSDGWHAFALSKGVTFGDLARTLAERDAARDGCAIAVKVTFDMRSSRQVSEVPRPSPTSPRTTALWKQTDLLSTGPTTPQII